MQSHLKTEKKVLNISFAGSLLFLISEGVMAWYSGSKAVLMDCVYDLADLIMLGPFMILIPLLYKPASEKRPFGFAQVESLFVIIKYTILLGVDIVLVTDSIKVILHGGNDVDASAVAIFEMAMSLSCCIMYLVLRHINRKYTSPSIKAELYIWKLDTLATLGVGAAFIISLALRHTSLSFIAPYVDPGIAIILAVILIKEPVEMILDSMKSILLFAPDKETFDKIQGVSEAVLKEYGYRVSFVDIVKTGRSYWVELNIKTGSNILNVDDLKNAQVIILKLLETDFENIDIEIIPDLNLVRKPADQESSIRRNEIFKLVERKEQKKEAKRNGKQGRTTD